MTSRAGISRHKIHLMNTSKIPSILTRGIRPNGGRDKARTAHLASQASAQHRPPLRLARRQPTSAAILTSSTTRRPPARVSLSTPSLPHGNCLSSNSRGGTDLFYRTELSQDIRVGALVTVEGDRGKELGKVVNNSVTLAEVRAFQVES